MRGSASRRGIAWHHQWTIRIRDAQRRIERLLQSGSKASPTVAPFPLTQDISLGPGNGEERGSRSSHSRKWAGTETRDGGASPAPDAVRPGAARVPRIFTTRAGETIHHYLSIRVEGGTILRLDQLLVGSDQVRRRDLLARMIHEIVASSRRIEGCERVFAV